MDNYRDTILSEYANSPSLLRLIDNWNQYFDPTDNINSFITNIWDVSTAVGVGLDIWGRIVGVQRTLQVATTTFFGFQEPDDPSEVGFNQAPFYSGQVTTSNYALTDPYFRLLIYAKALTNLSDCSIPSINAALMVVFGDSGHAYCTDGFDMTMTYTFDFVPSPVQVSILNQSGAFPKPAGVALSIVHP